MVLFALAHAKPLDGTALRDRVLPLVEEAAGRKFTEPPTVEVVRLDRFAELLAVEAATLEHLLHPDLPLEHLRAVGVGTSLLAPTVAGKYGLFDHTLYVVPEGLATAARALKELDLAADPQALAECIVAHELVHALQRDAFDAVLARHDREALVAFNMLAEGHATEVAERVCDALGHTGLRQSMRVLLGFEGDPPTSYAIGQRFVERTSVPIWNILASPPADTAMVWVPDRYQPGPPPAFDGWPKLREAATGLHRGGATVDDRTGYDALLRELGGADDARAALAGLVQAWQVAATDVRSTVVVRRVVFSSPEGAAAYVAAGAANCDKLAVDGIPTGWPVYAEPSELLPGLDGARCHVTIRPPTWAGGHEVDRWTARTGDVVHALILVQVERKPAVVEAALRTLGE